MTVQATRPVGQWASWGCKKHKLSSLRFGSQNGEVDYVAIPHPDVFWLFLFISSISRVKCLGFSWYGGGDNKGVTVSWQPGLEEQI